MTEATKPPFTIKGWHVLAGFVAAFSVIIGVNLFLAYSAVHTFPGLETKNSYVESQKFNEQRKAQLALGWDVSAQIDRGNLVLSIRDENGAPVQPEITEAVLGRATHVMDDQTPAFGWDGMDYVAPVALAAGNWNLRLEAQAPDGTYFHQRIVLHIKE